MKKKYLFNPYEMAICGFSNAGKTTLISKLIDAFKKKYKVGYVKHDAHHFSMDEGDKDTAKMKKNGASGVLINDQTHWALQYENELDLCQQHFCLLDRDFVLIEGHKKSICPKLVFVTQDQKNNHDILSQIENGQIQNVVGLISDTKNMEHALGLPHFCRDDDDMIGAFIIDYFSQQAKKLPLYGLVLSGGKGQRMNQDKGTLSYHGQNQVDHCYHLLDGLCDCVFISCRQEQSELNHLQGHPLIKDRFLEMGPMGGILSAMQEYPGAKWLVIACDLPYLNEKGLNELIKKANHFKFATAFYNADRGRPEPLIALYSPKSQDRFLQFLAMGVHCPSKVLMNSEIEKIQISDQRQLLNVNTPEDYHIAKNYFQNI